LKKKDNMTGSNIPSKQNESANKQPVPWRWLILGLIVTVAGCFLAWYIVGSWLLQPPPEPAGSSEPSVIVLTAPPSPTPAPTSSAAPPTPIPTFTPIPTPDTAVVPGELRSGYYAVVANTDNLGLTLRGGPSTRNIVVTVVDEGTIVYILDGPQEAENFEWWQLRLDNGLEGWAVGNYLEPAAEPQ
jgi:hypothetical protein